MTDNWHPMRNWLTEQLDEIERTAGDDEAPVLADLRRAICALGRALLVEHEPFKPGWPSRWVAEHGAACVTCKVEDDVYPEEWGRVAWPCETVRLFALLLADRPGYRVEWRPSE